MLIDHPRRQFTREDYYQMMNAGILTEDDNVELIKGEILEMSPVGARHVACVNRLTRLFGRNLPDEIILSVQNPVRLMNDSEPEPDITLLRFRDDYYTEALAEPEDVVLMIEVSDSTYAFDKRVKVPLYANAGILETWIINIDAEEILIYHDPSPAGYRHTKRVWRGDTLFPQFIPNLTMTVAQILGE